MKRSFLSVVVICTSFFVNCISSEMEYDDSDFMSVYPGMLFYNHARMTNDMVLDPVSIAMRFDILLEEMEEANIDFPIDGSEPDWTLLGDTPFDIDGNYYNKKAFLFGDETNSSIKLVTSQSESYYEIYYGSKEQQTSGRAIYDLFSRIGSYRIEISDGKRLTENGSSWSVSLGEDDLIFDYDSNDILCDQSCNAIIGGDGEGNILISRAGGSLSYNYSNASSQAWYITDGVVSIDNFQGMSMEQIWYSQIEMSIPLASGTTLSGYKISYKTLTDNPLIYRPSISNLVVGGEEEAVIFDVSTSLFPSSTVRVVTDSDGAVTYYYNGVVY